MKPQKGRPLLFNSADDEKVDSSVNDSSKKIRDQTKYDDNLAPNSAPNESKLVITTEDFDIDDPYA